MNEPIIPYKNHEKYLLIYEEIINERSLFYISNITFILN